MDYPYPKRQTKSYNKIHKALADCGFHIYTNCDCDGFYDCPDGQEESIEIEPTIEQRMNWCSNCFCKYLLEGCTDTDDIGLQINTLIASLHKVTNLLKIDRDYVCVDKDAPSPFNVILIVQYSDYYWHFRFNVQANSRLCTFDRCEDGTLISRRLNSNDFNLSWSCEEGEYEFYESDATEIIDCDLNEYTFENGLWKFKSIHEIEAEYEFEEQQMDSAEWDYINSVDDYDN